MAFDIVSHSERSTARPLTVSRLADSMSAAALLPTAAHSESLLGAFSSIPDADTVVLTDSNTTFADGPTMPRMICWMVATGGEAGAAAAWAGAARFDSRAPAMMNPMPAMN